MRYTTLNNGLKMPVIGLGTWKSKPGEVYQAVIWALKAGYRQIDCAQIYGNEKEIGQALQDAFKDGLVKREELWVTSKLWNNAHAAGDVLPALKKTLADLQLEYLDLYLIHWPVVQKKEVIFPSGAEDMLPLEEVPLSETWREMEKAVKAGLVRSIGLSNCGEKRIGGVLAACSLKPAVLQIENHPFLQQKELIAFCKKQGIAVTAYSPLGSQDRSNKQPDEPLLLQHPVILGIAERLQVSPAQVLIAWAVNRGVIVIPKSVNEERLRQNLEAYKLKLGKEDMQEIATLERGFRYVNGAAFAYGSYTTENIFE